MGSYPIPEGIDLDALVRQSTPGAEAGDTAAVSALCTAYLLKQDWEAAEPWARRLLDGRLSVVGMRYLAEIEDKRGDKAAAREWNHRADEAQSRMPAGFPMERLVGAIVERFGEEPDPEAVRAAAEAGDVMAMTALGTMLLRDPPQAVRWLTPGAEAGDTLAIIGLYSALTAQGDDAGAARWLHVATESGALSDVFSDFAPQIADHDKTRDRKDGTPHARAEEDKTGPNT